MKLADVEQPFLKSTCTANNVCDEPARTGDESRTGQGKNHGIRTLEERIFRNMNGGRIQEESEESRGPSQRLTRYCAPQKEYGQRFEPRICV